MKKPLIVASIIMLFNFFGCTQSKKDKVFKIFNEGVKLSLDAGQYQEQGNQDKAKELYEQSIKKYKEALAIDSTHYAALSPLGFSNYEISNYDEAIHFFNLAIKAQPEFAVNYQFLGLSEINKGRVEEGEKNIDKAFELDKSDNMILNTIQNLAQIAKLAYSYGEAYEKEGTKEKGENYKKFSVRVLLSAFKYSNNDTKVATMIEECATSMNDKVMLDWIKKQPKNTKY